MFFSIFRPHWYAACAKFRVKRVSACIYGTTYDRYIFRLASMGLAQAHPNNAPINVKPHPTPLRIGLGAGESSVPRALGVGLFGNHVFLIEGHIRVACELFGSICDDCENCAGLFGRKEQTRNVFRPPKKSGRFSYSIPGLACT